MAVTYTTAAARDAGRVRRARILSPLEIALTVASVASVLLMLAAHAGAVRVPRTETATGQVVDVNSVASADALEASLAAASSSNPATSAARASQSSTMTFG